MFTRMKTKKKPKRQTSTTTVSPVMSPKSYHNLLERKEDLPNNERSVVLNTLNEEEEGVRSPIPDELHKEKEEGNEQGEEEEEETVKPLKERKVKQMNETKKQKQKRKRKQNQKEQKEKEQEEGERTVRTTVQRFFDCPEVLGRPYNGPNRLWGSLAAVGAAAIYHSYSDQGLILLQQGANWLHVGLLGGGLAIAGVFLLPYVWNGSIIIGERIRRWWSGWWSRDGDGDQHKESHKD